jgi:Aspartyl/Asparaginyl beta-hydroxylase
MKLGLPLIKLPRLYCAATLAEEVAALPPSAWQPHPGKLPGNDAVPLVTPGGVMTDSFSGQMAATDALKQCPYIQNIMADLGAVWGRSRLMGLAAGAIVPGHVDIGYYWRTHVRVHIPVITNPGVLFCCADETVHMAAGECWVFDSFCTHNVRNTGDQKRVHLVLDTVGGEKFWAMIAEAKRAGRDGAPATAPLPRTNSDTALAYERINAPEIMSVWEIRCHNDFLLNQYPDGPDRPMLGERLEQFANCWGALWAEHGTDGGALRAYQAQINALRDDLNSMPASQTPLPNGVPFSVAYGALVLQVAASPA